MNFLIQACDLLTETFEPSTFSLVLDKGTYDAISLNPENSLNKRRNYIKKVYELMKPNGIFIITSCNWTDDELISHFHESTY